MADAFPPYPARARDAVRISIARRAARRAFDQLIALERAELDRLETEVVLVDVRADLEIARRALDTVERTLGRVYAALEGIDVP